MFRNSRILLTVGFIAALLIAIRATLPHAIEHYANLSLRDLEHYEGRIEDVDLFLWRGAYRIEGIRIVKRGATHDQPFFDVERVDFSVEWPSLLRGSIVSEALFVRPALNLVQDETPQASQTGEGEPWQDTLERLFPFRFNTIEVRDGTVTFRAPGIRSQDALAARHVDATVRNLTNVEDANNETFAQFAAVAQVLDEAPAQVHGSLDPWSREPTFDVNLQIRQVSLPAVNPWLRRFIKADAESGDFELYLEIAAADGKFKGYAKPILRNVNITSEAEQDENLLRKLWENIVELAADALENEQEDQVAARVPLSGSIDNPEAGVWATLVSVVSNAFVSAFARSIERSVSIRDLKSGLDESKDEQPPKSASN